MTAKIPVVVLRLQTTAASAGQRFGSHSDESSRWPESVETAKRKTGQTAPTLLLQTPLRWLTSPTQVASHLALLPA